MFNEIILPAILNANDRAAQHIDFFNTHMTDVFQLTTPQGAGMTTYNTGARGNRRFGIKVIYGTVYIGFYNLRGNDQVMPTMIGSGDYVTPFVYKIYKNGNSGILLAFNGNTQKFSIAWTKAGDIISILFDGVEYSKTSDSGITSFISLPSDALFPNVVVGFKNGQDMILPCYSLSESEVTISNTPCENIFYYTNFKKIPTMSEITINNETYLTISRTRILKY